MLADFFTDVDTRAALPGLDAVVAGWRPDVILRESWEFASLVVAEARGVPIARVALGSAAMEELGITLAAANLDRIRRAHGLAPDPGGEGMRALPYLTTVPARLEDPAAPVPATTHRFALAVEGDVPPLPDWWPGQDAPLVYVTFGSIAGAVAHMPYFPALYRDVLARLAGLPVRILVTVGAGADPARLGDLPANVHVEGWVAQDRVLPHAAAVVGHGGHGTTFGALAHGVPQVVLPLFSLDQWDNAAAVQRAGAGIALDADRATRRVMALPAPALLDGLPADVLRLLREPAFGAAARAVAADMAALPPVASAVAVLEDLVYASTKPS
jgi:UDP:flavonoid glycosyltransferase YjiC (YdhE family)